MPEQGKETLRAYLQLSFLQGSQWKVSMLLRCRLTLEQQPVTDLKLVRNLNLTKSVKAVDRQHGWSLMQLLVFFSHRLNDAFAHQSVYVVHRPF